MTADLPTLQELKCLYCRDAINHTKEECGDVISKKEVVKLLKAHVAAYQKLLNRKYCKQEHNAKEHKIARDAVLKLTDEIKLKDLEVEGKTI